MDKFFGFFKSIGDGVNKLLANPFVYMVWHATLGGVVEYAAESAGSHAPLTMAGLGHAAVGAAVGAAIGWARNSTNPTANQIADVVNKALVDKGVLKAVLLALLLAPVGAAWANPIGVPLNPPAGGEDAFLLAPVGALEFNPTNSSNYGLAFSESLGLARVNRVDDHHVSVDPYFFFGVFGAARISEWVNTNGNAPWSIDYGLMIGLPKLDESLPEVAFSETWNTIDRGDAKLFINVAFPVDILPDIFCRKINL